MRLYNKNHAVRRSDLINEDTENWGEKKHDKVRGKGGSGSCRWLEKHGWRCSTPSGSKDGKLSILFILFRFVILNSEWLPGMFF